MVRDARADDGVCDLQKQQLGRHERRAGVAGVPPGRTAPARRPDDCRPVNSVG
ncbi:hypothetical protein [Streptomyces tauricus]|uniref:hypothetical protein n=1 Tax=Streptomyces tauricus TaxID=68274 RepID=UPI00342E6A20